MAAQNNGLRGAATRQARQGLGQSLRKLDHPSAEGDLIFVKDRHGAPFQFTNKGQRTQRQVGSYTQAGTPLPRLQLTDIQDLANEGEGPKEREQSKGWNNSKARPNRGRGYRPLK